MDSICFIGGGKYGGAGVSMAVAKTVSSDNEFVQSVVILALDIFSCVQQVVSQCVQFGEIYAARNKAVKGDVKKVRQTSFSY